MYNKIILIGNLTRDIELRYTPSGTAVAKFGIATNRNYKDSVTGENKQETMFIDVTVFGRSAEVANQYLSKGRKVLVEGRLVLDQWVDQQGQKRSKHSVVAEKLQFMDSKSSVEGGNYNQYQQQPPVASKPEPKPNNDVPSIDIDEDEIPF
jgi:single-strand DNA-binding protein